MFYKCNVFIYYPCIRTSENKPKRLFKSARLALQICWYNGDLVKDELHTGLASVIALKHTQRCVAKEITSVMSVQTF